jgi:anti-sigma factor RsiW
MRVTRWVIIWSCARNRKHLNAYLDGELPERARFKVERHLDRCPACLQELDGLRGLAPFLENNDVPPVPAGLSARILAEAAVRQKREQVQKMSGRKRQRFLFRPWLATGATTAALIAGLAMGAWMGWTSYLGSGSAPWMPPHEAVAEDMYAFDVLGAEPQGSIEAATLALLDDKR